MPAEIELSIVVLCYRTEDYIEGFVLQLENEVRQLNVSFELILVANYDVPGKDKTPEIVQDLAKDRTFIKVVSKRKEGRMGWDMRSGLENSVGKYILIIDGDGQMPISDISTVYAIIKTGQYDLVKTFREKRFDGIFRAAMSRIYNYLFKLLFHPKFPLNDVNSKPKIMKRSAYEKMDLRSNDWFTDAEIMIEAIKKKMQICQISTVFYKNERRQSFVDFSTVLEFIYNLFYYKFTNRKR